jgi:hypothetical protein
MLTAVLMITITADDIKCMFGFNFGASRNSSGRVELILACLVSQK